MVSKSQKGFLIRQKLEAELTAKKKPAKKEKKEEPKKSQLAE